MIIHRAFLIKQLELFYRAIKLYNPLIRRKTAIKLSFNTNINDYTPQNIVFAIWIIQNCWFETQFV